jgi:hypothetical protein
VKQLPLGERERRTKRKRFKEEKENEMMLKSSELCFIPAPI